MFEKILIANRGEIAVRVMRTAKRMGIRTVAVYSDADDDAFHVQMADEAIGIGPPPATDSYLRIDRIVDAARTAGADAVHPGYGFLSENPEFVLALEDAGIVFVGPPGEAIAAMGDKITSKRIAAEAGVSTIPGYSGSIEDVEEAARIAGEIGFPVMIKAAAGGGGKGMRIAHAPEEVREGYERSRSEARSSFGDDRVFVEKFITSPRHIEIQVLADSHGNAVHLGERECSIQRRNQKVIEESPSPFLDAETRSKMGMQAVSLAKAVNYRSAGTVEFVVDDDRNFYFLEMNTRLQVEHPVTELVNGIDLVEQMIRVAAGERLEIAQRDISAKGWAVESRIYAEDPFRGFLPSTGRITRYSPPAEGNGVRMDSGVVEGSEISIYYDPMVAKLCSYGPDRNAALETMRNALDIFEIAGIGHNIPFLSAVMDHPAFVSGAFNTGFIDAVYPEGFAGAELPQEALSRIAAVSVVLRYREEAWAGDAQRYVPPEEWTAIIGSKNFSYRILDPNDPFLLGTSTGSRIAITADWSPGRTVCRAKVDETPFVFHAQKRGEGFAVQYRGGRYMAVVRTGKRAELAGHMPVHSAVATDRVLRCPMPGLLVSLSVSEGDKVSAGQTLATVEAMKMENVLHADRIATIARIAVAPGDSLAVDEVILEFE